VKKTLNAGNINFLRITLLAGLILLIFSGLTLTVLFLIERGGSSSSRRDDSFSRILREYDSLAQEIYGTQREYDRLHNELDRLEKRAISIESWLSILKRRRALAKIDSPSVENYKNSINNALKAYPSSQPIVAIASEALIKNTALNSETEEQLRQWLPLFNSFSFNNLRLAIHVVLGDFKNPQGASNLPADIFSDGTESITVDLALVKILQGDYRGALADIQPLLTFSPSQEILRFAAEYHYDFGDLLRSAEIFSLFNDEWAMIRQADALYLAGFPEIAATIWFILSDMQNETSLYNLAVTSTDSDASAAFLEKLVKMDSSSNSNSRQFALIRYSRLLDNSAAVALLRNSVNFSPQDYPYIDLEICKRLAQGRDTGRQLAETWLLLDRHNNNDELYKWAAWHFFFQRRFDEAVILLDRMELSKFTSPWIDIYRALYIMTEGDIDTAENILRSISANDADWYVFANLGFILETIRSPSRALEQYELAIVKLQNNKIASKVQFRIARCFTALNRPSEARRALQYALDLDPENLTARLELERLFK
jgi:tetratricopeptide (TPR) repeat protein